VPFDAAKSPTFGVAAAGFKKLQRTRPETAIHSLNVIQPGASGASSGLK
jgi:hypothetical protein